MSKKDKKYRINLNKIKYRRFWHMNPRERIREDKEPNFSEPCERCVNFTLEDCKKCPHWEGGNA